MCDCVCDCGNCDVLSDDEAGAFTTPMMAVAPGVATLGEPEV